MSWLSEDNNKWAILAYLSVILFFLFVMKACDAVHEENMERIKHNMPINRG